MLEPRRCRRIQVLVTPPYRFLRGTAALWMLLLSMTWWSTPAVAASASSSSGSEGSMSVAGAGGSQTSQGSSSYIGSRGSSEGSNWGSDSSSSEVAEAFKTATRTINTATATPTRSMTVSEQNTASPTKTVTRSSAETETEAHFTKTKEATITGATPSKSPTVSVSVELPPREPEPFVPASAVWVSGGIAAVTSLVVPGVMVPVNELQVWVFTATTGIGECRMSGSAASLLGEPNDKQQLADQLQRRLEATAKVLSPWLVVPLHISGLAVNSSASNIPATSDNAVGKVVGAMILLVGSAVISSLVATLFSCRYKKSFEFGAAIVHFPSISLNIFSFLLLGLVFNLGMMMAGPGSTLGRNGYVIVVCTWVALLTVAIWSLRFIFKNPKFLGQFQEYFHAFGAEVRTARKQHIFYPQGFWEPEEYRKRYGALFEFLTVDRLQFPLLGWARSVLIAVVCLVELNAKARKFMYFCHIQVGLLVIIQLGFAGVMMWKRPHRSLLLVGLPALTSIASALSLGLAHFSILGKIPPVATVATTWIAVAATGLLSIVTLLFRVLEKVVWRKRETELSKKASEEAGERAVDVNEIPIVEKEFLNPKELIPPSRLEILLLIHQEKAQLKLEKKRNQELERKEEEELQKMMAELDAEERLEQERNSAPTENGAAAISIPNDATGGNTKTSLLQVPNAGPGRGTVASGTGGGAPLLNPLRQVGAAARR